MIKQEAITSRCVRCNKLGSDRCNPWTQVFWCQNILIFGSQLQKSTREYIYKLSPNRSNLQTSVTVEPWWNDLENSPCSNQPGDPSCRENAKPRNFSPKSLSLDPYQPWTRKAQTIWRMQCSKPDPPKEPHRAQAQRADSTGFSLKAFSSPSKWSSHSMW